MYNSGDALLLHSRFEGLWPRDISSESEIAQTIATYLLHCLEVISLDPDYRSLQRVLNVLHYVITLLVVNHVDRCGRRYLLAFLHGREQSGMGVLQMPWRPKRPVRPTTAKCQRDLLRMSAIGELTSMQVGLHIWLVFHRIPRHVVVDDHVYRHYVDTTGDNIRSDEHLYVIGKVSISRLSSLQYWRDLP